MAAGPQRIERFNSPGAIVTGASSGLGREIAIELSRHQIHVHLVGRNIAELKKTLELCRAVRASDWAGAQIYTLDMTDPSPIRFQRLGSIADLYKVKYLVSCAGTHEEELSTLTINVSGPIRIIQAVLPCMQRHRQGTIVHINSLAGRNLAPSEAIYSASKHAMAGCLKSLRFELREQHIRVMDVFLGAVKTPMCKDRKGFDLMMEPSEVAKVIVRNMLTEPQSLQIEELQIGRFKFK